MAAKVGARRTAEKENSRKLYSWNVDKPGHKIDLQKPTHLELNKRKQARTDSSITNSRMASQFTNSQIFLAFQQKAI
jgi:hypothetical protein